MNPKGKRCYYTSEHIYKWNGDARTRAGQARSGHNSNPGWKRDRIRPKPSRKLQEQTRTSQTHKAPVWAPVCFFVVTPVTAGLAVEFWAGELSSKLLVFKSQLKERESNLKVRSRKHINVSAFFTVLSLFCQILSHSTSLTQNIMCRLSR